MFQRTLTRALSATVIGILALSGAGCALIKPREERAIELAEQRLRLDEVGDLTCTFWNSPPFYQPGNPIRLLAVTDVQNFDEIVTRLEEQGFVQNPSGDTLGSSLFYGPDGVDVTLYEFGPELAGTEPRLDSDEPCIVPEEGLVSVMFEAFPIT